MIRIVIFDLDGTLVDAYPAVARSVNFTLKSFGRLPKTFNQIKKAVGWGDRQLMVKFLGESNADEALKVYRAHHLKALTKDVKFLRGSKDLLVWLKKQGFLLAVATNRPSMFTELILKSLKVYKSFDLVLCADKVSKPKPYPQILRKICRDLKVKKQEALFVGDMTIDVECGKNAQIATIAVITGSNSKKELKQSKPYKIIDRLNELKTILKKGSL